MTVGGRLRRAIGITTLVVALSLPTTVGGSSSVLHADPNAVAKAQRALDDIEQKATEADARYTELQSQLDQATQNLDQATKNLGSQQRKVTALASHLGQMALSQYQTQGVDVTAKLLGSESDDDFLSTLATMESVQDRTNERIQDLQLAQAELASSKRTADEARAAIATSKTEQQKVAERYDELQAEAEAVLKKLTAEEKARLEAERKKKEEEQARRLADEQRASREAARAALEREQNDASSSPAPSSSPSSSSSSSASPDGSSARPEAEATTEAAETSASGSGRASQAVAYALAQVGKPYVMGSTGPSAYDCSGLMLASYRSAGVGLPRTSQAQYGAGRSVSMSNIQPGDLVFYYSGISHVGMYIGNGRIVDAANPRKGVRVTSLTSMPVAGVRRVA